MLATHFTFLSWDVEMAFWPAHTHYTQTIISTHFIIVLTRTVEWDAFYGPPK